MSTPRALWVLGVFGCTFVASVLAYGVAVHGGNAELVVFPLVVVSVPLLLVVHELGHALAATLVGYRVTRIAFTSDLDGWTAWEAPAGRATTGRTTIALVGGPLVTLAVAAGLLLSGPFHGVVGGWRAGLGTFAVLWTLDVLAPVRRHGIARDGFALAEHWRAHRARRANHRPASTDEADRGHAPRDPFASALDAAFAAGPRRERPMSDRGSAYSAPQSRD